MSHWDLINVKIMISTLSSRSKSSIRTTPDWLDNGTSIIHTKRIGKETSEEQLNNDIPFVDTHTETWITSVEKITEVKFRITVLVHITVGKVVILTARDRITIDGRVPE